MPSQSFLGTLKSRQNRPVGLCVRVIDAEISVSVVRGIDHGADIVQMFCHVSVALSHSVRIHTSADDGSEYVRRHIDPLFVQFFIGIVDKFCDDIRPAAALGVRLIINHVSHTFFCGKTNIVKLYLVKSGFVSPDAHLHQIVPDLLLIGIDPGQAFVVPVDASVRKL